MYAAPQTRWRIIHLAPFDFHALNSRGADAVIIAGARTVAERLASAAAI